MSRVVRRSNHSRLQQLLLLKGCAGAADACCVPGYACIKSDETDAARMPQSTSHGYVSLELTGGF